MSNNFTSHFSADDAALVLIEFSTTDIHGCREPRPQCPISHVHQKRRAEPLPSVWSAHGCERESR